MSEVSSGDAGAVAVSKPEPPARGQKLKELCKRASAGDQSCLPEVQALFDDGEYGETLRDINGSMAERLRLSLIGKAGGKNILIKEAITQKIESVRTELEGPTPTPIERLLAERASVCWFIVHWYEDIYVNSSGWTISQADLQQRKIDKAHARFLSAVRTLAQVRKLALPTLQLNIAKNQVNVAETRS